MLSRTIARGSDPNRPCGRAPSPNLFAAMANCCPPASGAICNLALPLLAAFDAPRPRHGPRHVGTPAWEGEARRGSIAVDEHPPRRVGVGHQIPPAQARLFL